MQFEPHCRYQEFIACFAVKISYVHRMISPGNKQTGGNRPGSSRIVNQNVDAFNIRPVITKLGELLKTNVYWLGC